MKTHLFLYHNYDMLLIAIQALDPYALDKLTDQSCNLNILELFAIRTNSIMRYTDNQYSHNLYYTLALTQDVSSILLNMYIQQNVYKILQDIAQHQEDLVFYSSHTLNYINRFKIHYRKSFGPYLVGYKFYSNDKWLIKLSLINLFVIYNIYEKDGIYFIYFYLLYSSDKT
uniref:Uncharacterized protein n=1 Tax=Helminthocladia australis TaxID=260093 RepID=A0A1G4NTS2_9FLOR|nr:Hypothetical protein ORF_6 [Helminthocladia australis]SCW22058.1 Hypothetical protein ORF_6 [Helminthocladia australis]